MERDSNAAETLEAVITSSWSDYDRVLEAIAALDNCAQDFLQVIDAIAIRPGPQLETARALAAASEKMNVPFAVEVDARCP